MTAKDALIFLGGANLGAAAYEYGLARLTRVVLDRGYASFDARLGAGRVPGRLLQRGRAGRARDDRVLRRRHARGRAGRAGAVLRRRADAAPRLPRRAARIGDPPRRLPAGQPARDRALARARARRPRLAPVRALHAPVRGDRGSRPRRRWPSARSSPAPASRGCSRSTRGARRRSSERYATVVSAYCADSATEDRAVWETFMRAHRRARAAGRRVRHRRAAPLPPLRRRRQAVPERGRRRARPARRARRRASSTRPSRHAGWPGTRRRATRASCSRGRASTDSRTPALRLAFRAILRPTPSVARQARLGA